MEMSDYETKSEREIWEAAGCSDREEYRDYLWAQIWKHLEDNSKHIK